MYPSHHGPCSHLRDDVKKNSTIWVLVARYITETRYECHQNFISAAMTRSITAFLPVSRAIDNVSVTNDPDIILHRTHSHNIKSWSFT